MDSAATGPILNEAIQGQASLTPPSRGWDRWVLRRLSFWMVAQWPYRYRDDATFPGLRGLTTTGTPPIWSPYQDLMPLFSFIHNTTALTRIDPYSLRETEKMGGRPVLWGGRRPFLPDSTLNRLRSDAPRVEGLSPSPPVVTFFSS